MSCPGTPAGGDREFSLTANPGAICYAFGSGNINGNNDAINQLDGVIWMTLAKSDDAAVGTDPFKNTLSITGVSGLSGQFNIVPAVWGSYGRIILALKSGNGHLDPDWVALSSCQTRPAARGRSRSTTRPSRTRCSTA